MDYRELKDRHRAERAVYHPNLSLRVHRALSWLDRAEQLEAADDRDGQFIFLWIAFNAAYATEIDERYRLSEQETFRAFLQKLVDLDVERKRIEALVWTEFPKSIRVLLDNPYVFAEFWQFHNGRIGEAEWKQRSHPRRRDVGQLRQPRPAARLHQPHGQAGAAGDRDHDGSPRHAVGGSLLSGGGVTTGRQTGPSIPSGHRAVTTCARIVSTSRSSM